MVAAGVLPGVVDVLCCLRLLRRCCSAGVMRRRSQAQRSTVSIRELTRRAIFPGGVPMRSMRLAWRFFLLFVDMEGDFRGVGTVVRDHEMAIGGQEPDRSIAWQFVSIQGVDGGIWRLRTGGFRGLESALLRTHKSERSYAQVGTPWLVTICGDIGFFSVTIVQRLHRYRVPSRAGRGVG